MIFTGAGERPSILSLSIFVLGHPKRNENALTMFCSEFGWTVSPLDD